VHCQCLYFTAPYQIEFREVELPGPAPGELLVQTLCSAISPGTELMIYRGKAPKKLSADETIPSLESSLAFPLQYGYSAVGKVIEVGVSLSSDWLGKTVFSFQPHQSFFTALQEEVIVLPDEISIESAVFIPNMESAINLVMDGRPIIGERAAVFGQGIIGLLTTALLARFPLKELITLDLYPNRRTASLDAGATQSYDPEAADVFEQVYGKIGVDLAFEISGSPTALDQAIRSTGFSGRVVCGSWYGQQPATLNLGGAFHRSRIQLISSQVSTIDPSLRGRWEKTRRFELAWKMIREVSPERWITHKLPFDEAAFGYTLLDQHPEKVIQVLLDYT